MLLVIDGGNTNIVFGLQQDADQFLNWRKATDSAFTADDYASWLAFHLSTYNYSLSDITGVIISTVVPETLPALQRFAKRYLNGFSYVLAADDLSHGVTILIDKPEQAGADRIANAAAVSTLYTCPSIVIDFGTATTFDYISAKGEYCGGAISPGVNLSIDALYRAAARLPLIDPSHWQKELPIIGKTTIEAMNSGLFFGYISLFEGIISRIKNSVNEPDTTVVATGGLGAIFCDASPVIDTYDPILTLKGLAIIFERQQV